MQNFHSFDVTIDSKETARRIKQLRLQHHLSISDVQEIFSFESERGIRYWESGKRIPTIDNLVVLATLYNVQIEDVLAFSVNGEAGRLPAYLIYLFFTKL
ncbi:MAG: XRE family transcriptional regulator [Clostridia bacterium]|nr:helix-turn-helix transcriptional regulator [Lachnospiraceae bacterium]NCC00741.1 XRE family transcriptional regulator [Clostridia bacterium]NCD03105.1 XRE family transcriptional regulator [Clostridia bacterium]